VATSSAQLYKKLTANTDLRVVYMASSSPVVAGVVDSLKRPGGNVTGVTDALPVTGEIDAMKQVMPDMKRVAVIWKNGDPNGDAVAQQAVEHLKKLGMDPRRVTITNLSELTQATQSVIGKVDAINLPGDVNVLGGIAAVMKVANEADVPVFGSGGDAVKAGAVLGGTYDYEQVGDITGDLVLKVLRGADPATTPVVMVPLDGYAVNDAALKKFGLEVPPELSDKVTDHF
jgi:putative ABC transport system substrate-binding protein